jgi:hypothetical protein
MRSMRARAIAVLFALGAVLAAGSSFAEGTAPATAEEGDGAWIGLFTEKGPEDMAETLSLEARLGRRFASLMWFTDFSHPFPAQAAENAWAAGSIPNVTWEPWFWTENNRIRLVDINAGSWDGYISAWGAAAAAFGKPILVRWGHEFNGDWYPWGIAKNGQDPQTYVRAYRRVHDLVVRSGAKNVSWVWCPNASSVPAQDWNDPLAAYPGDDYVDWIAIDGYDFDGNASFADLFSKTYTETLRKADKPIYIGEFATGRVGSEKAAWLEDMHASLTSQFPGIKGIVYFSVKKERDWRLDDSPESFAGASTVLSQPYYKSKPESIARLAGAFHQNYAAYKKGAAPAVASSRANILASRIARDASGKLDWSSAPKVAVAGKNGLGGAVSFGWDAERLYVKAEIACKFPLTNAQKDDGIWNGDCLELCLSTDPKADPARLRFGATDWQLGFAPNDAAKSLPARSWEWSKLRSQVPGAETSSLPADGGYALEASFPWQSLKGFKAEAGMVLGFDFAVDDAGAAGTRSFQWIWNGSNQFYNSPAQWGTLTLAP